MKYTIISKLQRKVPLLINLIKKPKISFQLVALYMLSSVREPHGPLKSSCMRRSDFVDIQGTDKTLSGIYHPSLSPYCSTKDNMFPAL